jgi:hypothetical protein
VRPPATPRESQSPWRITSRALTHGAHGPAGTARLPSYNATRRRQPPGIPASESQPVQHRVGVPAEVRRRGWLVLAQLVALPAHDRARLPRAREQERGEAKGGQVEGVRRRQARQRVPHVYHLELQALQLVGRRADHPACPPQPARCAAEPPGRWATRRRPRARAQDTLAARPAHLSRGGERERAGEQLYDQIDGLRVGGQHRVAGSRWRAQPLKRSITQAHATSSSRRRAA